MPFSLLTRLRPQRAGQLFYLGLATVLLLGGLATWWLGESASRQAKRQLLDQTIGLAHALNTKLVNSLPFDGTDQDLPAYQRIRNQFIAYGRVCGISQIWSETRRDGHLLFGPENLPPGSPMASKPGTVYQRPSAGNLAVYDTGLPAVEGPYTDEFGTFVSAFAPVKDARSGKIILVVGTDIIAPD